MSSEYRNDKLKEISKKNQELEKMMPRFIHSYIYGMEENISALSINIYLQRLYTFFRFLHENNPELASVDICDIPFSVIEQLTSEDIDEFLHNTRQKITDSPTASNKTSIAVRVSKTINNYYSALNSFFHFFYIRGKLSENIMEKVSRARNRNINKPFVDGYEEQERFLTSARSEGTSDQEKAYRGKYGISQRDYMICLTFLRTGLRVSELVSLDLSDVRLDTHCFTVLRKEDKDVRVYFDDDYEKELKEYVDTRLEQVRSSSHPLSKPLFAVEVGKYKGKRLSVRSVQKLVKHYAQAAGLEDASRITPHRLRASFASNLLQATDRNLYVVQQRMSHESPKTTEIYLRKDVDLADTRNALKKRLCVTMPASK